MYYQHFGPRTTNVVIIGSRMCVGLLLMMIYLFALLLEARRVTFSAHISPEYVITR